ncbi:Fe(3+) ABC transporter substrate-binding protein [Wolbachia endosymbiont of Brugia malayi]|uniref:Fe(3+) ABC transporter substrate-binding protein n=1 Tax=Wolbachia endosymbiont of Brugia malayi TaxID=80849 RepID=UPI00004C939B|nr:Fe(3+) ABC transporter substrate-binding protein [Wolbachia endosymbiont of Brugia malayi]AAW70986.1 ABC-type Fe3+ transport system, periplasmic component [Wolbachia endosymbiont strain TRS of Brugia malayi]QCB61935.1 Fe(3+) ABC transporter substrate-binding protein [Wolbachia endosymbiont of Brugia malayi]
MKKALIFTSLVVVVLIVVTFLYKNNETNDLQVVNVYSSRKEELVRTLFDEFTRNTGIKVRYIIDDYSQLLSRMENGSGTDVFLTADAVNLILAKKRGLLSQVNSEILKRAIPEKFRDSEGYWFGLTKRTRILVYNKESVDPKDLSTYEDLANKKWKGKILVRSSTSPYNRSLIAFMIANNGFEKTKEWVSGIVSNMARKPSGGDTNQIYAVAAGEGDIAIVNSYYFARILSSERENKKNVANKLGVFFPNHDSNGVMVNISGAAVTKNAKNRENAIALLEFLVSKQAQELYAKKNQEYPIIEGVEVSNILKFWGDYPQSDLPLSELEKHLFEAVMIADECKWK